MEAPYSQWAMSRATATNDASLRTWPRQTGPRSSRARNPRTAPRERAPPTRPSPMSTRAAPRACPPCAASASPWWRARASAPSGSPPRTCAPSARTRSTTSCWRTPPCRASTARSQVDARRRACAISAAATARSSTACGWSRRSCAAAACCGSGSVALRFELGARDATGSRSRSAPSFGSLVGRSVAMRASSRCSSAPRQRRHRAARGRDRHRQGAAPPRPSTAASARARRPVRGGRLRRHPARTSSRASCSATRRARSPARSSARVGAFEEADGGTIFLDEIGELPLELQPKLLRVLERREIRRVGSNTYQPVDVRVIAATNRDLRAEVNAARFRSDLYFRLAVVRIAPAAAARAPRGHPAARRAASSPPLRRRTPARSTRCARREFLAELAARRWPGNVRELRNYLERCLVFEDAWRSPRTRRPRGAALRWTRGSPTPRNAPGADDFERRYLRALLEKHHGKVAQAATGGRGPRVPVPAVAPARHQAVRRLSPLTGCTSPTHR